MIVMIMIMISPGVTPNLPTNIVPTNIARVKLSGEIPCGHENSTPYN